MFSKKSKKVEIADSEVSDLSFSVKKKKSSRHNTSVKSIPSKIQDCIQEQVIPISVSSTSVGNFCPIVATAIIGNPCPSDQGLNLSSQDEDNIVKQLYILMRSKESLVSPFKKNAQKTRWCFTWNNYPDNYEIQLRKLTGLVYLICGQELAPTTGTRHLQGFMRFSPGKSFEYLVKNIPGIHVEEPYKCDLANKRYCIKSFTNILEIGELANPGERNDLLYIRDSAIKGLPIKNLLMEGFVNPQQLKYIDYCYKYLDPVRQFIEDFKCYYFYGKTGTWKTKTALEMFPNAYICMDSNKWWEGYDGQKEVIIDDFRSSFCPWSTLLKILQPDPYRVECKGGSRQLLATTFIITSCFSPEKIYKNIDEHRDQLYRRITEVRHYTRKGSLPPVYKVVDKSTFKVLKKKKNCVIKVDSNAGSESD